MGEITAAAQTAARRVHEAPAHWVATLARLGYATIGIVYVMIGTLATQAALGTGGAIEDTRGVLVTIARQPFGRLLLGATALGLSGYVLWRLVQACLDPERKGTDARGLLTRLRFAVSGLAYAGLAVLAARMALGAGGRGSHGTEQEWTALVLAQPFGVWLVCMLGGIIIVVGLAHFYRAYTAHFMQEYATGEMSARQQRWAKRLGQWGLAARGVTFGIIGGFLLYAGISADPSEARGLGGPSSSWRSNPTAPGCLGWSPWGWWRTACSVCPRRSTAPWRPTEAGGGGPCRHPTGPETLHRAQTSGFAIPIVIMLSTLGRRLADDVRAAYMLHEQHLAFAAAEAHGGVYPPACVLHGDCSDTVGCTLHVC
jgi:hypothetical protein